MILSSEERKEKNYMKDIIIDTLIDTLKLIPFLFITFILLEYIEHKFSKKNKEKISKAGKYGPILGSILGAFPQCGFSVMATNLYMTRIITIGTLISVYLSTSDEMLPILISEGASLNIMLKFVIVKVIIGMICGILIDLIYNKKNNYTKDKIEEFCTEHNCNCNHNHSILKSAIKHTFNIVIFILIVSFILNVGFHFLGEEKISKLFLKNNLFSPFISSLIGLIPNCGASVILTQLYLNKVISFASCLSGLLTGSGVALLILFRVNKDKTESIKILLTLYLIGSISGIIIEIIEMLF